MQHGLDELLAAEYRSGTGRRDVGWHSVDIGESSVIVFV
jgi:hypothetical protein